MKTIVLGGGCFWCFDASYKLVKGVVKVEQGYSGGTVAHPTDEQIYYNNTGHAEVVRVSYDENIICLEVILEIFWTLHDPTTLNRQGIDIGSQYRSIVFYANKAEKKTIEVCKEKAQQYWDDPIVTEIAPLGEFYSAASYHNDYKKNRPDYCQIIINPKLQKLKKRFSSHLK